MAAATASASADIAADIPLDLTLFSLFSADLVNRLGETLTHCRGLIQMRRLRLA
jgi:hypothetical protein